MNLESISMLLEPSEIAATIQRAESTLAMMNSLSGGWISDQITPADFNTMIDAIEVGESGLKPLFIRAAAAEKGAEGRLAVALDGLHAATVKAVGVARLAWAADPARAKVVAALRSGGQVARDIVDEAEAWEIAWEEVDPAFAPVAGLTLAAFQTLLAATRTAQGGMRRAAVHRRQAGGRLAAALAALDETAKSWYALATVVFDATTPEGAALRGTIPTTYQPKYYQAAKRRRKERKAAAAAPSTPPA